MTGSNRGIVGKVIVILLWGFFVFAFMIIFEGRAVEDSIVIAIMSAIALPILVSFKDIMGFVKKNLANDSWY